MKSVKIFQKLNHQENKKGNCEPPYLWELSCPNKIKD